MVVKNEELQEQTKRLRFKTNVHGSGDLDSKFAKQKGMFLFITVPSRCIIMNSVHYKVNTNIFPEVPDKSSSLFAFLHVELTRGYLLEHDEERFSARREKVYSFIKIPQELEKFMAYGFFQCADSLLFVYTFLPLRFIMAFWSFFNRLFRRCFR